MIAEVTERPLTIEEQPIPESINKDQPISGRINEEQLIPRQINKEQPIPGPSRTVKHIQPAKLPALPVAVRPVSKRKPRTKMPTLEITSSPVKSILEMKEQQKILNE